ncbi:NAD-dependent epimerase/dehydratase family protein [Polynucleobacter sp. 86C-FISCH]|uniref:NAD-dependent epimerase/dehydratase family protein n=1 Tax=Polynucleobacter sp. 86C-FISCH TaxID=2689101 RepID=UPI001C0C4D33|nr:NAD-dependent epimerase/dehydratase family protein [Polynucleobacter sp. 86C-FISCH]MBU3596008.1 NAD-dependent epimerase/dehydratase family protein [Polynucleobacter sp. 86C-FISCH]
MSVLITGVAGFVGSNLAKKFIADGIKVVGLDNLCRGDKKNISELIGHPLFSFHITNLCDLDTYAEIIEQSHVDEVIKEVWHMAANSDIPAGITDANIDLCDTFMTTFNTLELMRRFGIKIISFASSSAVYGDLGDLNIDETTGPLFPISNYGAMKLASEAIISAAVESFLDGAFIFRFPNVIGLPATHGVILDFIRRLNSSKKLLEVLGDGNQQKSYLHVEELVDAMFFIRKNSSKKCNYFNIGPGDDGVTVRFIAEKVRDVVAPNALIVYGKTNKGWVGDVPKFYYSIEKLRNLGWSPTLSSEQAILRAVQEIYEQETGF